MKHNFNLSEFKHINMRATEKHESNIQSVIVKYYKNQRKKLVIIITVLQVFRKSIKISDNCYIYTILVNI